MAKSNFAVQMRNVSKQYFGTCAVDDVDFEVCAGEVHALIGENGAGKSTLMKILAGSFRDYTGQVLINGKEIQLYSPRIAKSNGIGMIYQELSLALSLSVAENVLAGRLPVKNKFFLDQRAINQQTKVCLEKVGLGDLDPMVAVEKITQPETQLVEIAKVIGEDPHILVMDEPTSALAGDEVEHLFAIIENLKNQGIAIIYISHHLSEVFKVADRVTVMRDGKVVATKNIADVTVEELAQMMVGRFIEKKPHTKSGRETEKELLRVGALGRHGFFRDVSFRIMSGEIIGICGLSGAGQTELGRSLGGADPIDEGTVFLDGKKFRFNGVSEALRHGIAYLTEDRKIDGLALRLAAEENILAPLVPEHCKNFLYKKIMGKDLLQKLIASVQIYPAEPMKITKAFSGGNQQKIMIAKSLSTKPRVLILNQPTRGVDIGAKDAIHRIISEVAAQGTAVILISSDLPEITALSDRLVIMQKGTFVKELDNKNRAVTEELLLVEINKEVVADVC